MEPYTLYQCFDENGVTIIRNDELISVIPVTNKSGEPKMMVNYYDEEICTVSTMFCNRIEKM